MIICTSCNIQKDLSHFEVRRDTGQPRKQCRECRALQRSARYQSNREDENKKAMVRYLTNHEQEKVKRREYYRKNKDAHKVRMAKWREANPEKDLEIRRSVERNGRNKPYYKYREMLWSLVRRLGHNDHQLLGYSMEEFKADLEAKFEEGMTWENHGDWEIDHIKPVIQFYKEGIVDPKVVNALSNLQPLWRSDNRKKSSKYIDE